MGCPAESKAHRFVTHRHVAGTCKDGVPVTIVRSGRRSPWTELHGDRWIVATQPGPVAAGPDSHGRGVATHDG
jgi:hypothetical protein